jgi:hypothetical protein
VQRVRIGGALGSKLQGPSRQRNRRRRAATAALGLVVVAGAVLGAISSLFGSVERSPQRSSNDDRGVGGHGVDDHEDFRVTE